MKRKQYFSKNTKNKKIIFAGGSTRCNEQTIAMGFGRVISGYKDYFIIAINLFWIWCNLCIMLPGFMQRKED